MASSTALRPDASWSLTVYSCRPSGLLVKSSQPFHLGDHTSKHAKDHEQPCQWAERRRPGARAAAGSPRLVFSDHPERERVSRPWPAAPTGAGPLACAGRGDGVGARRERDDDDRDVVEAAGVERELRQVGGW